MFLVLLTVSVGTWALNDSGENITLSNFGNDYQKIVTHQADALANWYNNLSDSKKAEFRNESRANLIINGPLSSADFAVLNSASESAWGHFTSIDLKNAEFSSIDNMSDMNMASLEYLRLPSNITDNTNWKNLKTAEKNTSLKLVVSTDAIGASATKINIHSFAENEVMKCLKGYTDAQYQYHYPVFSVDESNPGWIHTDFSELSNVSTIKMSGLFGDGDLTDSNNHNTLLFNKEKVTSFDFTGATFAEIVLPSLTTLASTYTSEASAYIPHEGSTITKTGVNGENPNGQNVVYTPYKTNALYYINGYEKLSSIILPTGNTEIPPQAFVDRVNLTSIEIPSTYTEVGAEAFLRSGITYLKIGKNITTVQPGAFASTQVRTIEFERGIKNLNFDEMAFGANHELRHVVLPEGVLNLGNKLFYQCDALRSIRLPHSLQNIGNETFKECHKLVTITIPPNLKTIGKSCFPDELKDVYLTCKSVNDLPLIWTAGAKSAVSATSDEEASWSSFGSASLVNNNTNYENEPLSQNAPVNNPVTINKTWDEICDLFYQTRTGVAQLHYPSDFDDPETAFAISILNTYGCQSTEEDETHIRVPELNHCVDANNNLIIGDETASDFSDFSRRIKAADKDPNNPAQSILSRTGWRQFILTKSYFKDNDVVLEKDYKDVWYTMCFPFHLTDEQLEDAFGAGFNICAFTGVTAETSKVNGVDKRTLVLHFTDEVAESEGEADVLADAFCPYMIHPNFGTEENDPNLNKKTAFRTYLTNIKRIKVDEVGQGDNNPESHSVTRTVDATDMKGNAISGTYEFIGRVKEGQGEIPYGSYFLATADGANYPQYWRETGRGNSDWSQYSAIVKAPAEFEKKYFGIDENAENWVKAIDFYFDGYETAEELLNIEQIVDDAKEQNLPVKFFNIVYDMNGKILKKGDADLGDLPTGMYIVNGKKYMVK